LYWQAARIEYIDGSVSVLLGAGSALSWLFKVTEMENGRLFSDALLIILACVLENGSM
jgi:hypothetical protein